MTTMNWTREQWKGWLTSNDIGKQVQWGVASKFDPFRQELGKAWKFALAFGLIGSSAAVLALGWFLREPYLFWGQLLALAGIANGCVLVAWCAAYFVLRSPNVLTQHKLQEDIASECGETALDVCADALSKRADWIDRNLYRPALNDLIRAALPSEMHRLTIEELEKHLLEKFKGGRFVNSEQSSETTVFLASHVCTRCAVPLRSSNVRTLGINGHEAMKAGLLRSDVILPSSIYLRFVGKKEQYEAYFPSLNYPNGGLDFHLCPTCAQLGRDIGILIEPPEFVVRSRADAPPNFTGT